MSSRTAVVWFRADLRLRDNAALIDALSRFDAVVPVFIWAPNEDADWPLGDASRKWLHHALESLQNSLRRLGSDLYIRTGSSIEELRRVISETDAEAVFWTRRYEPHLNRMDAEVRSVLQQGGIDCHVIDSSVLHDVGAVRTTTGHPYRVFTPFWKKVRRELRVPLPLSAPGATSFSHDVRQPQAVPLKSLGLIDPGLFSSEIDSAWDASKDAAHRLLSEFVDYKLAAYPLERDRPDHDATSRLSPYLRFGLISPAQVWHAVEEAAADPRLRDAGEAFLRQIGWREFGYHLLHHFPRTVKQPLHGKFAHFSWRHDDAALDAWKNGRTGYPFVDAGMRQMNSIGWMHNRLRMITASFLTKDLLLPWQDGAQWFWERLVDADLASNTLGWQWSAGCGADAQPFFRIFNPVAQGKKFDPDGAFVRKWLPELRDLSAKHIHEPWRAGDDILRRAGIRLGETYPRPMVDHGAAREAALAEYDKVR